MKMCAKQLNLLLIYCSLFAHRYFKIAELRENNVDFQFSLIIN